MGVPLRGRVARFESTLDVLRHLADDQREVLTSYERLGEVRTVLARP